MTILGCFGGTTILGNTHFGLPPKSPQRLGSAPFGQLRGICPCEEIRRQLGQPLRLDLGRGTTVGTPFLGDGCLRDLGGVLMEFFGDFWGIFGGSHCFREMFVVRLESLFLGKKTGILKLCHTKSDGCRNVATFYLPYIKAQRSKLPAFLTELGAVEHSRRYSLLVKTLKQRKHQKKRPSAKELHPRKRTNDDGKPTIQKM